VNGVLTSTYCCAENVGIEPIVVAELKLGNVQRHIFGAHLVECADYAALEDRPEAFNRIRVDRTDNVLLAVTIDRLMVVLA
jgi:hypothetical protein